ncbi:hypothetical protein BX600DRAFT_468681 [Xylariales sp. PMI_506]|nr:hypothetical protein BX600DRAFT_468681 [Xylariales sp. PMI_506]
MKSITHLLQIAVAWVRANYIHKCRKEFYFCAVIFKLKVQAEKYGKVVRNVTQLLPNKKEILQNSAWNHSQLQYAGIIKNSKVKKM